jgi:hypothetical protein
MEGETFWLDGVEKKAVGKGRANNGKGVMGGGEGGGGGDGGWCGKGGGNILKDSKIYIKKGGLK